MIPIKRLMPFGVAGVMGIGAVVGVQQIIGQERRTLLEERRKLYADYQEPVEVIISRKDLPEGTVITAEYLDKQAVPKKFVQPYASPRAGDFLGLVTRTPVKAGEQIMSTKLQRPEEAMAAASLSGVTPKGKRAVTIGADLLSGVGGFVRPGDKVDILWTFQVPAPGGVGQKGELVTMTLFQNVDVLAVGSEMLGKPPKKGEAPGAYSVTLALTPEEAQLILYAREQGQVQLSLRAQGDENERVAVAPIDSARMLQSVLGAEPAAAQPPSPRTVEVFKGLERSLVSINE